MGGSVCACANDPDTEKQEFVASARRHAQEGRIPEAVVQYRNAIAVDPRFGEARLELGRLLEQQGELAGAAAELVRAADLLPENGEAQLGAARIYLATGKYEDGLTRANKALAIDPKNIDALVLKGTALAGQTNYDAALEEIERAIALDPSRSQSYGDLGALQLVRGRKPEAETAFKRAIEVAPEKIEPRIALAGFYIVSGQTALAEHTLSEALRQQPRNPLINRALAMMFLATGRSSQAEQPLKIVAEEGKDARSQLALADYYRLMNRDDDALGVLERVAADKEAFGPAMTRKAAILRLQRKNEPAYGVLEEVLQKEPRNTSALVLQAAFLTEDGRLDAAMSMAAAAAKVQPDSVDVQFALGRIHQLRGNAKGATAAYLEVVRLQPRHPEALLGLARLALLDLRSSEARGYVQDALRVRPDYPEAQLVQARLDMSEGRRREAEQTLRRVALRFPKAPAVQAQLGTLYLLGKDERSARAAYERALSMDAVSLEAVGGLAELDLKAGKTAAALERVDKAVAARPGSAPHLVVAAKAHAATGNVTRAEELLRAAINADPARLVAYGLLAEIYIAQERIDKAIAELEIAARLPDGVGASTMIAILLEQQNKTAEARTRYERILEANSSAPIAANNLAWIYAENGVNLDRALELAQSAKRDLPESPDVTDTLGWVYYRKKMFPQAVASLKEAAALAPENVLTQYHLGLAYTGASDYQSAKPLLIGALKAAPQSPLADEARAALKLMSSMGL